MFFKKKQKYFDTIFLLFFLFECSDIELNNSLCESCTNIENK